VSPSAPSGGAVRRATAHLSALAVVLAGWELLASRADALARLVGSAELWTAVWLSNQSLLIGFPLAAGAGVLLGLALGHWPGLDRWLGVHLNLLLVAPKSALMPLIVMAFGFGLATRAGIVATFAFPVVAVTTRAGVLAIDPRLIQMARAFGASRAALWRHVLLPGAAPAVMTALRFGLARSLSGMVAVELLLVAVGVGRLILTAQSDFDAAGVYATVLVVIGEAVAVLGLVRIATARREAWADEVAR
jgi:ABC-type nitrate/sulfonate/bicarbonate transport system permease component